MLIILSKPQWLTIHRALVMNFIFKFAYRIQIVDEEGELFEQYARFDQGDKMFYKQVPKVKTGQIGNIERSISFLDDNEKCLDKLGFLNRQINEILSDDGMGGSLQFLDEDKDFIQYFLTEYLLRIRSSLMPIGKNGGVLGDDPLIKKTASLIKHMGDDTMMNSLDDFYFWEEETSTIEIILGQYFH